MSNNTMNATGPPGSPAAVSGPKSDPGIGASVQAIVDSLVTGAIAGAEVLEGATLIETIGVAGGLAIAASGIAVAGAAGLLAVGIAGLASPSIREQLAGISKMLGIVTSPAGTATLVAQLAAGVAADEAIEASDKAATLAAGFDAIRAAGKGMTTAVEVASFLDNVDKLNSYAEEHSTSVVGNNPESEIPGLGVPPGSPSRDNDNGDSDRMTDSERKHIEETGVFRIYEKMPIDQTPTDQPTDVQIPEVPNLNDDDVLPDNAPGMGDLTDNDDSPGGGSDFDFDDPDDE